MIKLTIKGQLTDLNRYTYADRSHWSKGAEIKNDDTDACIWQLKKYRHLQLKGRYHFTFTWFCKDMSVDPDNVCFAKKFVMDGLVKAEVLHDDKWRYVAGFEDKFEIDAKNPRVEIEITEV